MPASASATTWPPPRAIARPLSLARRSVRPLGRVLLGLGAWLLRYGKDESATHAYRPTTRSSELN